MNGYSSYEAWNTALWIDNTEKLQRLANDWVNLAHKFGKDWKTEDVAELYAERMMLYLEMYKTFKTGDGVEYTKENVKEYFETNL